MKIAVTGKDGQLGRSLKEAFRDKAELTVDFFNRQSWDITNKEKSAEILNSDQYDYLINTAAYTAVDKAEKEKEACHTINNYALDGLVEACNSAKTHLVHISSDYVYDNGLFRPLKESDPCDPKGQYALSKYLGEEIIRKQSSSASIIRTSWVYSSFGHNFVKTMIKLSETRPELKVVQDQWGCPTSAHLLAEDIRDHFLRDSQLPGVVTINYTQSGFTNWFEFAKEIFDQTQSNVKLTPISSRDFPTLATRPKFSVLNCDLFDERAVNPRLHWTQALHQCLLKMDP